MTTSDYILYREKKIFYKETGKGPVIVFLHGFMESSSMWDDFSKRLEDRFRVICIDLPGHGNSAGLCDPHTMEEFADVVKAVCHHLQTGPVLMIGHSMGGYVTLAFARNYPRMLKGFVLFHSTAASDTEDLKKLSRSIVALKGDKKLFITQFFASLFAPGNAKLFSGEIDQMKETAVAMKTENIIAALRGMRDRSDQTPLLADTSLPVLFIIGKEDSRIKAETVFSQAFLPAQSRVLLLGGTGHMGFLESREATFHAVESFISYLT